MNMMMKMTALLALGGLAACGQAENAADEQPSPAMQEPTAASHSGTGTIEKIRGSEVTIAHGPIRSLGWPAMTMAFTAEDQALLSGLKVGDRISFTFVQAEGGSQLTAVAKQ
jgi:Cu/Ag efflux protein CusF